MEIEETFCLQTVVKVILRSEKNWKIVAEFIRNVLTTKKIEDKEM